MVTGLEAVGLVLAIIPVVVEILDFYSGSLTSRDVSFLTESLRNKELIFKNTVEELLSSILSKSELRELLEDPGGPLWTENSINERVADHLGAEASNLFEYAKEIHSTVHHLKEKLPVSVHHPLVEQSLLLRMPGVFVEDWQAKLTESSDLNKKRPRRSKTAPESQASDQSILPWASEPCQFEKAES